MWNLSPKQSFKRITMVVIILLFIIMSVLYFWPRPIIGNAQNVEILSVSVRSSETALELTEVLDYDEQAIVECLMRHKAYPSLMRATGYNISDVTIQIVFVDQETTKSVLLGDINYLDNTYGKRRYIIENPSLLKNEVLNYIKGENIGKRS